MQVAVRGSLERLKAGLACEWDIARHVVAGSLSTWWMDGSPRTVGRMPCVLMWMPVRLRPL